MLLEFLPPLRDSVHIETRHLSEATVATAANQQGLEACVLAPLLLIQSAHEQDDCRFRFVGCLHPLASRDPEDLIRSFSLPCRDLI